MYGTQAWSGVYPAVDGDDAAGQVAVIHFAETGLPWIPPSPNMPSVESALHYPGTCLFEGTNMSVGRGTDRPFQQLGAPWLDSGALVKALTRHGLPGVRFESVRFTPVAPDDGKYGGIEVHGVRVVTTDRSLYDPTVTAVAVKRSSQGSTKAAAGRLPLVTTIVTGVPGSSSMRALRAAKAKPVASGGKLRLPLITWGGDVATAAIAHLAHSTPERFRFSSTDFNSYVTVSTAVGAPQRSDGKMAAPDRPGLGVDLRYDVLGDPVAVYQR